MKPLKFKIHPGIIGALAGTAGLAASSGCTGNCTSCFGCVTAGGAVVLYAVFGEKIKKIRKKNEKSV